MWLFQCYHGLSHSSGLCTHFREVKLDVHVPYGTSAFYRLFSQTRGPCPLSVVDTYTHSILCFFQGRLSSKIKCLWKTAGGLWPVLQTIKSVLLWQPWDLFSQEQKTEVFVCIFTCFSPELPSVFYSSSFSALSKHVFIRMCKPKYCYDPRDLGWGHNMKWIKITMTSFNILFILYCSLFRRTIYLINCIFNMFCGSAKDGWI